jgi:hypothetical protein
MPDPATIAAALAAASAGVDLINKIADSVIPMFTGSKPETKEHRMMIKGDDGKIVALQHGRKVKVITGADLKQMPADLLDHVRVYEASAQVNYEIWKAVYPQRNASADAVVNAKTEQQLRRCVRDMKDDLDGILHFLETAGIQLDDHYLLFRDAIQRSG